MTDIIFISITCITCYQYDFIHEIETYGVVNVTEIVEKWSLSSNFSILERPESKTIIFTCESCGLQSVLINSARSSRRPFLIINMADTIYVRNIFKN